MFPLDQIADVGVSPSIYLKLISREIISKYSNLCDYVITVPERRGQTDGRTDDIVWHNRALRSIAR